MRYDAEDWMLKKKWKDSYSLEEVVKIPPLQKWGIGREEPWQSAARDIKRYDVAVAQEERVCVKSEAQIGRRGGEERRKGEEKGGGELSEKGTSEREKKKQKPVEEGEQSRKAEGEISKRQNGGSKQLMESDRSQRTKRAMEIWLEGYPK